jgi:pyruvate carboxylase
MLVLNDCVFFLKETNRRIQLENVISNINNELDNVRSNIKECLKNTQLNKEEIEVNRICGFFFWEKGKSNQKENCF